MWMDVRSQMPEATIIYMLSTRLSCDGMISLRRVVVWLKYIKEANHGPWMYSGTSTPSHINDERGTVAEMDVG